MTLRDLHLAALWLLSFGYLGRQPGRRRSGWVRASLRRGAMTRLARSLARHMTRPARHTARAEITTTSLPRTLIARTAPWSRLHGTVLAGAGAAALNAWLDLDSHGPQAEAMLACLLGAVLHAHEDELARSSAPADDRQDRVRERIEAELGEETLSPARLARQLNMSHATLYRAFQPLEPIHRWRRNRRLLHFKALLNWASAASPRRPSRRDSTA